MTARNHSPGNAYWNCSKVSGVGSWGLRYSEDGYAVDFVWQSALRYREDGRSITFSSEPLFRIPGDVKARLVLTVYVHYPLRWDNPDGTEIQNREQEQITLFRLETALKQKIGDYEITSLAI